MAGLGLSKDAGRAWTLHSKEANYPLARACAPELKIGVDTKKVWLLPREETTVVDPK